MKILKRDIDRLSELIENVEEGDHSFLDTFIYNSFKRNLYYKIIEDMRDVVKKTVFDANMSVSDKVNIMKEYKLALISSGAYVLYGYVISYNKLNKYVSKLVTRKRGIL